MGSFGKVTMKKIASKEDGYTYGDESIANSPITMDELERLKISVGFKEEDRQWLKMAGEVLADQVQAIVTRWRSEIIASIPHLARHSRSLQGDKLPGYLAQSNLRFEQWILDTCLREYEQDWLNYQHEIALRHTSAKKNSTDGVESTTFVPYRDIAAFTAVLVETMKPYLAAKGNSQIEVEAMYRAWGRSLQLQIALWAQAYMASPNSEW